MVVNPHHVQVQSHQWTRIPSVCTLMSKFVATCEVKVGQDLLSEQKKEPDETVGLEDVGPSVADG